MNADYDHVIVMTELENDRVRWECSCGPAGSAASWTVDIAAEKHVKPGETVAHRTSGGGAWS